MSTTGIPTAHDQRPAGGPGPRPQAASELRGPGSLRAAPCAHAWPCRGLTASATEGGCAVKSSEAAAHAEAAALWASRGSEPPESSNSTAIFPFCLLPPDGQLCAFPEFTTLAPSCSTNQPRHLSCVQPWATLL